MHLSRALIVAATTLALGACGQAELSGPVSGSQILVDLLGEEGAQFASGLTSDEQGSAAEVGEELWQSLTSDERFSWIGNFELRGTVFDSDRLYLLEANSGSDVDFDGDGEYDEFPSQILGSWHAIVDGEALRSGDANINLLTESVYQFIRDDLDSLDDGAIRGWLDSLASSLVEDVNDDGVIDYADLMAWNNASDRPLFSGDPQLLDNLAEAIAAGDEAAVQAAVDALWASLGLDPEEFRGRFAQLEQDFLDAEAGAGAGGFFEWLSQLFQPGGDAEGEDGDWSPWDFFGGDNAAGSGAG